MLGKLLKHEWKATWRYLALLNGATILIALIGKIGLLLKPNLPEFVILLYVALYTILLFGASIVNLVLLSIRFYRNLFTDEGYLTNTLPVTAACKLNVKILNCLFWVFINTICTILSVVLFVTSIAKPSEFQWFLAEWQKLFMELIGTSSQFWALFYLLFSSITGTVFLILMIYFSISIGCAFNSHKVLASVITFLLTYVVVQVLSTALMMLAGFHKVLRSMLYLSETLGKHTYLPSYQNVQLWSWIFSLVATAIFYFVTRYMMTKKLNLN